jgi:hypothetical protein
VIDLLIVGVVGAVPVLAAADRIIKTRAQARRLRTMSERLAAATARADEQQEKLQEAAKSSAALTSVMPAIKRPPLTLPGASPHAEPPHAEPPHAEPPHGEPPDSTAPHGTPPHGTARPRPGCGRTGPQDHAHPRRPSRTGEHAVHSADRVVGR